jgi:hypothetical protein
MAALAEYAQTIPGLAERKVQTGAAGLNRRILQQIEGEIEDERMTKSRSGTGGAHGGETDVCARARVRGVDGSVGEDSDDAQNVSNTVRRAKRRDVLRRWEQLIGLIQFRPQYIREREAKRATFLWQDRQLASMYELQGDSIYKERIGDLKRAINSIDSEMEVCRQHMREAIRALERDGWNLDGVLHYNVYKEKLLALKPVIAAMLQRTINQRTYREVHLAVNRSLDWRKRETFDKLFDIFADQKDEVLDADAKLTNIAGGYVEAGLLKLINKCEFACV